MKFERDIFAEEPAEQFGHVADGFAQVERPGLHDIFAAEHEQLPREAGGAFGGKKNRLHRLEHFGRQRRLGEQRAGMSLDDRQHVVEIVRDAGGELADGFHFLRLPQLFLQIQMVGGHADAAGHGD